MGLFRSEEQYIEYSTNIKESFYTFVDRPQFIDKNVDGFSGEINGDSFYFYKNHLFMSKACRTVLFGRIINDHTISYCYGKFSWAQAAIICFCAGFLIFALNDVLRAVLYGDNINLSENLLTLSLWKSSNRYFYEYLRLSGYIYGANNRLKQEGIMWSNPE